MIILVFQTLIPIFLTSYCETKYFSEQSNIESIVII